MASLPSYHVIPTRVVQDTQLREDGMGIEPIHKVTYQIDSGPSKGKTRTIVLSEAEFNGDDAKSVIEADLQSHQSVANLSG